jgi:hypothetical protein
LLHGAGSIHLRDGRRPVRVRLLAGPGRGQHILDNLGGEAEILYINGDANVTLRPRETGFKDALNEGGIDLAQYTSIPAPAAGCWV